jgi:TP901 family phage tail tape measure protein
MASNAIVGILRVLLTANTAEFDSAMKRVSSAAGALSKDLGQMGRQATQLGASLTRTLTLQLAGLGIGAIKAASDFESSFAGIRKTVSDATDAMGNLTPIGREIQQGMRDLAKQIPINVNELNRIGEAAGQLGIKSTQILGFTKVMADLGVTTNLSSDQAATALARFANIMDATKVAAGTFEFDRLGATIVGLGNNFATTEAEIVEFGLRIAGAGKIAGLTEAQVLGIGTALSSVGVEAEAGGTAVQKVLLNINQAVAQGNDNLEIFARTAGMNAQDFAAAWEKDAGTAFTKFVEGLGKSGKDATNILAELGLEDQRLIRSFLSLANAGDLLNRTMGQGGKDWQENIALVKEANQRYQTFESQLKMFWAQVRDVGVTIGTALLPTLRDMLAASKPLIGVVEQLAHGFAALPTPIRVIALGIAGLAAAAGPLIFVFGQLAMAASALTGAFAAKGLATARLLPLLASLRTAILGITWTSILAGATSLTSNFTALGASTLTLGGRLTTLITAIRGITFASLVSGAAGAGLAIKGFAVATLAAAAPVVALGAALWGLYQILRAGEQAWGLYIDAQKRAAGAAQEEARQQKILAEATRIAGRPITDLAEAKRIYYENVRKVADAQTEAAKNTAAYTEKVKALQAEIAKLNPNQREQIDAAGKLGKSNEEIARTLRVSVEVIAAYRSGMGAATTSTRGMSEQLQAAQKVVAGFTAEQRANIIAGDKLGRNNEQIAQSLKLTGVSASVAEAAVKLFTDSLKGGGRTAEQIAEGPFKKLKNRIIELDAQLKAAEKEGPKAYALAIQELGDDLVETDTKARMLGGTLTNTVAKGAAEAAARMRDEWARAIKDMDLLPGGGEAGPDVGMARFEQERDLQKRRLDIIRKTEEQTRALQGDTLQNRLQQLETERMAQIETARSQGDFTQQTLDLINNLHRQSVVRVITDWRDGLQQIPTLAQTIFASVPNLIQQAFTGGGGLGGAFKALFSNIGSQLFGEQGPLGFGAGGLLNKLGNKLTSIFGDAFGLALPGIGQAIGALIGPLASKIGGFFKNLFGGIPKEVQEVRKEVVAFHAELAKGVTLAQKNEAAMSGWGDKGALTLIRVRDALVAIGRSANEADRLVRDLLDTDDPERARRAMEEINGVLQRQQELLAKNREEANELFDGLVAAAAEAGTALPAAFLPGIEQLRVMGLLTDEQAGKLRSLAQEGSFDLKQLEQDAESLGIEFNALGPKFRNARLSASFEDLFVKMNRLIRAGGDMGTILSGTSDEISELVNQAKAFGTSIPQQFKPWIEELLRAGKLVDENGDALTDLKGINFGDPIVTAIDKMTEAFQAFLDKITQLPSSLPNPFKDWTTPDIPAVPNRPAPGIQPPDVNRPFDDIAEGARRAQDAVDGLNFGTTPGGLKEIPIQLGLASDAVKAFQSVALQSFRVVKDWVDQALPLQALDGIGDRLQRIQALNVPEFQTPSRLPMLAVPEIPYVRVHVSTAAFNPTDLQREGGPQAVGREIHNHPVIVVDKSGRSLDDVTSEVERRIAERDLAGNALGLRDAFEAIAENVVDRRLARAF